MQYHEQLASNPKNDFKSEQWIRKKKKQKNHEGSWWMEETKMKILAHDKFLESFTLIGNNSNHSEYPADAAEGLLTL